MSTPLRTSAPQKLKFLLRPSNENIGSHRKPMGFTVLELLIAVVFLLIAATVFFVQKRDLEIVARDSARKTSVNAIYYNLEDVFYPANKYYPQNLTADKLRGLDPTQLKDPGGIAVGVEGSNFRYEAVDCTDGKCKSYTLTADLENEADFVKTSRNGQATQ